MPAACCKNNGGSWVSCYDRSLFLGPDPVHVDRLFSNAYKLLFPQALYNESHTECRGDCHTGTNQPGTAEASSKPLLPYLITLPRPCRVRRCAVALRCQPVPAGTLPIRLCSKLRNLAPPRTLVRSTTYAVRGRRLQIPASRRFDCFISYCCLSRGIRAVNRPVPRRCRTLFSLRERPWHTRKPYLGKHRPAPIRQKIR